MRVTILALALAANVLAASGGGDAAPVCETRDGESVRCGAPGAMPVGRILSPAERQALHPDTPMPVREVLSLIAVIGGLFALIALMPRFDGAMARTGTGRKTTTAISPVAGMSNIPNPGRIP